MDEVLKELNLDPPTRDLFASTQNSRCKEFFGEEDDAMSKSWVGCLNWGKPPFAILSQVGGAARSGNCRSRLATGKMVSEIARSGQSANFSDMRSASA